ncbi:MAG TPA: DUF2911 domain-containing protein [Flavitalea sp.]|nr:DUF2911 domain-containing protein [Flavitalea sp.]
MKRLMFLSGVLLLNVSLACAQADKSQRPSPPAKASETTASGATITIDYSQPSVKGRKVGGDIAPYGKVWRSGANEATLFEVSKDVTVEGKPLPAGKYTLWSIPGEKEWVVIFNKKTGQWGTQYTEADDFLRVPVKTEKSPQPTEKLVYTISKDGKVSLIWGDKAFSFNVK